MENILDIEPHKREFKQKYEMLSENEKFECVLRWLTVLYSQVGNDVIDSPCCDCKNHSKCPCHQEGLTGFYAPSVNFLVLEQFVGRGRVQYNGLLPEDQKDWPINLESEDKESCWRPYD